MFGGVRWWDGKEKDQGLQVTLVGLVLKPMMKEKKLKKEIEE